MCTTNSSDTNDTSSSSTSSSSSSSTDRYHLKDGDPIHGKPGQGVPGVRTMFQSPLDNFKFGWEKNGSGGGSGSGSSGNSKDRN